MILKTPFRFLLVGCGHIGKRHADLIQQMGTLVAVCDTIQDKANAFGFEYHCAAYHSYQQMLENEKADITVVCTPNGLHAEHSIAALQKHLHVLCEKPMALTVKDCTAMIDAAIRADKKLFIVKQNRFNEPVQAVRNALLEDQIGDLLSVQLNCFWNRTARYYEESNWKGRLAMDGGILFTQFSHFIDLLYWYLGDVAEVKSFAKNYIHQSSTDFEDCCVVILHFKNGAIGTGHFTTCAYDSNMEGSITIFGTKGTVKIGGQYLNTLEYQQIQGFQLASIADKGQPNNYGHYTGSMSNHDKMYAYMFTTMADEAPIPVSTYDALKTVEIINKIYQAVHAI